MTKKELRALFLKKRNDLTERERLRLSDLLLIRFQEMALPESATILLNYWPLQQRAEINTFLMADYLHFRIPGLQVAYPVVDLDDDSMTPTLVHDDTEFRKNIYGIAEPINGTVINPLEIDIVFVPLLAFDKNGTRIGYGKGFYDRFLPRCRPNCIRVGFSYFDPVDQIEDVSQFDVPLTIGITPDTIYEF